MPSHSAYVSLKLKSVSHKQYIVGFFKKRINSDTLFLLIGKFYTFTFKGKAFATVF